MSLLPQARQIFVERNLMIKLVINILQIVMNQTENLRLA